MATYSIINFSQIKSDRLDAEFFKAEYVERNEFLKKTGNISTLGRLFKHIQRGSQPEYNENGTIKVLRSVNVGFLSFNETRQEYVTENFLNKSEKGTVRKNDILITSTGVGTLGRTSIWHYNDLAVCDGHITILRNGNISPYLISAFLNSKYGLYQFDKHYRGSSGQIEIYPLDLSKFLIPDILFDYSEEIENMIKTAFELEEDSKQLYLEAKSKMNHELDLDHSDLENMPNKYISSFSEIAFSNRFDGEYYNPKAKKIIQRIKQLNHVTIGSNFTIKNGFPWKSSNFLDNNSGRPVVRIRDIKPTFIDNETLTSLKNEYADSINFTKAQPNDIVIGMDGVKYFYGSLIEEECLINQRVCHISPKDNALLSSEYVELVLNSDIGQSQLLRDMTIAGTVGHITNANIAKLIIPVFTEEVHETLTKLVRKSIDAKKKSKQLLRDAILRIETIIDNSIK